MFWGVGAAAMGDPLENDAYLSWGVRVGVEGSCAGVSFPAQEATCGDLADQNEQHTGPCPQAMPQVPPTILVAWDRVEMNFA